MSEVWQRWNAAMSRLVEVVQPAVVQVQNGRHGAGAGTVWHPDGLILEWLDRIPNKLYNFVILFWRHQE